jgi:hypothetical protein
MDNFELPQNAPTMNITNAQHFLDSKGAIAPQTGPARAFAEFIGAIIALATHPDPESDITVKCRKKKCHGEIFATDADNGEIDWSCSHCDEEGIISEWKGTLWDLTSLPPPEIGN